ncbi:DnaD domain protein [Streptococcus gordonii]|uniref:DnaD domain protein n=1 Tax=Streptococcus gordonii TaxID=1302 RepID=UPI0007793487|nr:DnaD domain protein [Streptococcus gordonii]MBZ2130563.1 DnaD domain protein [Streptococcus gordonii]MCY7129868.1 DnaD domain protein [Streptococcus gordonii]MCY7140522.1 DnaD domain protein [Streptococcus gordonii]
MRPNDQFSYLKNNLVSQDTNNLIRLYLPIIGREAVSLYLYCLAFWDNGRQTYTFGHILNHLNMGMEVLKTSFERLSAMNLLELYRGESTYQIKLFSLLSADEFFQYHVYKRLLEKKIGETAVEDLMEGQPQGQPLARKLSTVFDVEDEVGVIKKKQSDFDLTNFKRRMAQENLRFADEKEDLLDLFAIAEQQNWTWYETYVLARETAISHVISVKRMKQKLAQKRVDEKFTQDEQIIIRAAKSKVPMLFLAELKKKRQATITQSERQLLLDLAKLGLLDEVINIVLLLTLNKVDSANLNEKYALKVANDFAYQKVTTAEEAVMKIRERNQQIQSRPAKSSQPVAKSNVPDWSQPDYKNETSAEKQAELEEQKRRLLAKIEQGGD